MRIRVIPLAGSQASPFIPAGRFDNDEADVVTATVYRSSNNPDPVNNVWHQQLDRGVTAIAVYPEYGPTSRPWSDQVTMIEVLWTTGASLLTQQGGLASSSRNTGIPIKETDTGPILIDLLPQVKQRKITTALPPITIYAAQIQ